MAQNYDAIPTVEDITNEDVLQSEQTTNRSSVSTIALVLVTGALTGTFFVLGHQTAMQKGYFNAAPTFDFFESEVLKNALIVEPREKAFSLASSPSVVDLLFSNPMTGSEKLFCFESENGQYCCENSKEEVECINYCAESGWNSFVKTVGMIGFVFNIISSCAAPATTS